MSTTEAIQQYRRTILNGKEYVAEGLASDIRQEITISANEDGFTAEVALWNISRQSWNAVEKEDRFAIELGYWPSPQSLCITGTVDEKESPEKDDASIKYVFRGKDETEAAIKKGRWSNTWVEPTISRVVRDIAGQAGVGIGTIDAPGQTIKRRYPISKEKTLAHWLDEMVEHANSFGDEEYHWTTDTPQLSFMPKSRTREEAVLIKDGRRGNTITLDPSEGTTEKTEGTDDMSFEALLDPRIRKDGLVKAVSDTHPGVYRVQSYELNSNTEDGSHEMSGTLAPTDAEYRATKRGQSASNELNVSGVV